MANTKVTGDVIANGTISTVHIADDAITAAKLDSTATGITFADLAVSGNSTLTGNLTVNGAFTSQGIDDNADAIAITINGNEEVGIGTTSPFVKLHVETTASSIARFSYNGSNYQDLTYEGSNIVGGSHVFKIAGSEKMRLDTFGNVGIAATDPVKTLDVRGQLAISNNASSYWYMDRNSSGYFQIIDDFDNPALTIDTSRNVGIGYTSPNAKLEIGSGQAKTVTSGVEWARFGTSNEASNYATLTCEVKGGATAADRKWIFQTIEAGVANAGNIVFQPSGGNVGIGTTSPTNMLSIKGASGSSKGLDIYHSNGNKVAQLIHNGSGDEGMLNLYDSNVETVRIAGENNVSSFINSGSVGIGTTSPIAQLDVSGNTNQHHSVSTIHNGGWKNIQDLGATGWLDQTFSAGRIKVFGYENSNVNVSYCEYYVVRHSGGYSLNQIGTRLDRGNSHGHVEVQISGNYLQVRNVAQSSLGAARIVFSGMKD